MFGISALGWVHTLGSLPAIPAAAYMLARHGRIVPRSTPGLIYLVSMVIGAASVFIIARQPVSAAFAALTLVLLLAGYGVGRVFAFRRAGVYLETILLSATVFLLMLPTVSEVLRRVPDGHPIVTDPHAPLLIGTQVGLLIALIIGIITQVLYLRRQGAQLRRVVS